MKIKLSGDRRHWAIRFGQKIRRKFPRIKDRILIDLWDGYRFSWSIVK